MGKIELPGPEEIVRACCGTVNGFGVRAWAAVGLRLRLRLQTAFPVPVYLLSWCHDEVGGHGRFTRCSMCLPTMRPCLGGLWYRVRVCLSSWERCRYSGVWVDITANRIEKFTLCVFGGDKRETETERSGTCVRGRLYHGGCWVLLSYGFASLPWDVV